MFVKICGITRAEDARLAAELGASAVGFVFWPGSPRFIEPDARARDRRGAAAVRARRSASSSTSRPSTCERRAPSTSGLSAVQLHGDEDVGDVARARAAA